MKTKHPQSKIKVLSNKKFTKEVNKLGAAVQFVQVIFDHGLSIQGFKSQAKNTIYFSACSAEWFLKENLT